jgi:hypothetical protein
MRCVTHTLLERLAASTSASGSEAAAAAAAGGGKPSNAQDPADVGSLSLKQQQQQQQGLMLPVKPQQLLNSLDEKQGVLPDPQLASTQGDSPPAADVAAVAAAADAEEGSRPGTSGTSYSALSIYTDQQLTARSSTFNAEAAALQRWQQQQRQKHTGHLAAAAAAAEDDSVAAGTPGSTELCSHPVSSATPESSASAQTGSKDSTSSYLESRSTIATSSSSDTSAATSTSTSTAASNPADTAGKPAACGADVLALQQFQAALVLLSRKCFPRIANAARAWKLLIERHIQPLADRKRSR